jgi:hypothetical protein
MLNPLFVFGFTSAQTMWEAQLKLLRTFTGAFDQPERAKEEGGAVDEFQPAAGEDSIVQNKTASTAAARPESVITDEERIRALKEVHARALEHTGKGAAKRTMRLSSSAKRSHRKGR